MTLACKYDEQFFVLPKKHMGGFVQGDVFSLLKPNQILPFLVLPKSRMGFNSFKRKLGKFGPRNGLQTRRMKN